MSRHRRFEIGEDSVTVIDGLFDREEVEAMHQVLALGAFKRTETDNPDTAHIRQLVLEPLPAALRIGGRLKKVLSDYCPELGRYEFFRGYCNSLSYGDMCYPHRDCGLKELALTVLIYPNRKWDRDWGGETFFYDRNGEVALAVLPRPGRVVLFPGRIEHRAGAPLRDCHEARFTLAYKYRPSRKH